MSERRGFSFHVGGIEDGMAAALTAYCESYKPDVGTYSGELDEKNLRAALSNLQPRFPLYLVSYGSGDDTLMSALGPETGAPRVFRHDCSFAVISCDNNARGETERRRGDGASPGVWAMIEDSDAAIARIQFVAVVGEEKIVLNPEPMNPAGVSYIAQLPDMTAYARHYETHFIYQTPDRRKPGSLVREIQVEMFPASRGTNSDRPGLVMK